MQNKKFNFNLTLGSSVCKVPLLNIIDHDKSTPEPQCKLTKNWGNLIDQIWRLDTLVKSELDSIRCQYRKIIHVDDFRFDFGQFVDLIDGQSIQDEVIEVKCEAEIKNQKRIILFENLYAQIIINKVPKNELKLDHDTDQENDCTPLNIMLLSYDSVSRVSWIKRLPKTYAYLTQIMGSEILTGYNIVGDGTPAALIPIFTGKTEEELPSGLKNDPNGKYVDEIYPFLWKDLHPKGYSSIYLDDWPHLGCFSYRMRGFRHHTTRHYFKHYQLALWKRVSKNYFSRNHRLDDFCIGDTKRHKSVLNILKNFASNYSNVSNSIAFMHYIENSHDTNERFNWVDNDLFKFLKESFEMGLFDNTAIFLYSDHGPRFTDKSTSNQRYLEERLPFFSLYLPKRFRKLHPDKIANLNVNKHALTSPFDIYATVRELTCLNPRQENNSNNRKRSISLLDKISKYRSCFDIGVSDHYCVCIEPWQKENVDNFLIVAASQFSVESINQLTNKVRHLCVSLSLKKIISAEKLRKEGMNFTTYKIEFTTLPNNGVYEVLIYGDYFADFEFKSVKTMFSIKSRMDISRIDAYGTQPACVSDFSNNPEFILDLRKFCFCKKQPKSYRNIRKFGRMIG